MIITRYTLNDGGFTYIEQPSMRAAMRSCISAVVMGVSDVPTAEVDGVMHNFIVGPLQGQYRFEPQ